MMNELIILTHLHGNNLHSSLQFREFIIERRKERKKEAKKIIARRGHFLCDSI